MILLLNKENWLALYVAIVYVSDMTPEEAIQAVTESTHLEGRKKMNIKKDGNIEARMIQRAEKSMRKMNNYFDRFVVGDVVELQSRERPTNRFRLMHGKVRGVVIYKGRYLSVKGTNGVVITVNYSDVLEKKIRVSRVDVDGIISKNLGDRSEGNAKVEYGYVQG